MPKKNENKIDVASLISHTCIREIGEGCWCARLHQGTDNQDW